MHWRHWLHWLFGPAPARVYPQRISCSGFELQRDGVLIPIDPIYLDGGSDE